MNCNDTHAGLAPAGKPRPSLNLVGLDGNAFAILGRFQRRARQAGWSASEIERVMAHAKKGDYGHLLSTMVDVADCDQDVTEDA